MTRRGIMKLLHTSPDTAERLAALLQVDATILTSELTSLAALDLARVADGRWSATQPTLEASITTMEQRGEDPDMEITAYHPLQPRH